MDTATEDFVLSPLNDEMEERFLRFATSEEMAVAVGSDNPWSETRAQRVFSRLSAASGLGGSIAITRSDDLVGFVSAEKLGEAVELRWIATEDPETSMQALSSALGNLVAGSPARTFVARCRPEDMLSRELIEGLGMKLAGSMPPALGGALLYELRIR